MSNCGVCEAEAGGAFLCKPCLNQLERDIGDMTSLMHEVSVVATRQANVYRAARRAEPDTEAADLDEEYAWRLARIRPHLRSKDGRVTLPSTALPIDLDARELLYDINDTLLAAACDLGADEISSRHVVAWLLTHINDVRFHEDAARLYDELTYIHRRAEHAVDRSASRVYAGPCQAALEDGTECDRDLYLKLGADEIRCDGHRGDEIGCGAVHAYSDRRKWLVASLDDALVGLDVLRACARSLLSLDWPPHATVRSWASRGRIVAKSIDRNGTELFRAGDVLALVRRWQSPGTRRSA